jgi:serine/threonine protein kinase
VLLCELIGGFNPFHAPDAIQICENIIKGRVNWPKNIDIVTKDLLLKVLVVDPDLRFGIRDIKSHKIFSVRVINLIISRTLTGRVFTLTFLLRPQG